MTLNKHQFKTFYHGTPVANAESIEKEGLKAMQNNPQGSPKGVYLGDLKSAEAFGGAVFAVDLPESLVSPVGMTGDWGMVTHNISPHALRRVK
jgi:hypothetical protein